MMRWENLSKSTKVLIMVARNAKGAIAPQKIVEDLFTHEQQAEMKTQLEEMAGTDLEDPLV